ncbi:hypothetical protein SCNU_10616 [Gordonia neofelifaecis NRRL B-59395]|uniref:Uncharacterized protein n=1 Tax=Gordonia neofelifaecis NRRL B-59395 TaxID=644548 RepID=F1YJP5_9ACTN|nr:hypothetical protein SCNU_10616 [Gordonia neofelifaecis NRRL B-59395]
MIGGAAAVVVGAVQTTDTLAATNDAVSANTSQIASENFFPTPLPSSISCSESGTPGFRSANVSWPSAGPGMKYRVVLWTNNMAGVERGAAYQTGTSWTLSVNYNIAWGNYVLTVETMNIASGDTDQTRLYSSGYRRITVGSNGQRNGTCEGGAGVKANATWEDQAAWTPAQQQTFGRSVLSKQTTPTTESNATTSASPSPTATETPKPSESETETPSSSEIPTPSETETSTPESSAATEPVITVAAAAAGEESGFIVYHDGVEKCSAPKANDDVVTVGNNEVTLTTKDGAVKTVDVNTCKVS